MSRIPPKPEAREGHVQRRVVGSAPELGKIGRMTTEARSRRKSKPGQKKGSSRRKRRTSKVLINWLVLLLSIAGLTFGGVLFWSLFDHKDSVSLPSSHAIAIPALPSDEAIKMVKNMLAAENAADLGTLIRPGQMSSRQAFAYLQELPNEANEPPKPNWIGTIDSLSVPIEVVSVRFSDSVVRNALFTPDDQENWKLDFDAFAQLCVPEFTSLVEGREEEGLVRVHIKKDNYFNTWFGDEADWDSYLLTTPSTKTSLYGYCRRGSIAHTAMEALHQRVRQHTAEVSEESNPSSSSKRPIASRATLYVKRPPEADTRQFEITNVISDEWVISDKPFDERLAEQTSKPVED